MPRTPEEQAIADRETFIVPAVTPPDVRERWLLDIARRGARDPGVAALAAVLLETLTARLGRAPTAMELVQEIMDRTHDLVTYYPDWPEGSERFQSVRWTLGSQLSPEISPLTGRPKGVGDCEEFACVVCAFGIALGFTMRPVWHDQSGPLNHVAAEVCACGPWALPFTGCIPIEATVPGARPGMTPAQAVAAAPPEIRARIFGA